MPGSHISGKVTSAWSSYSAQNTAHWVLMAWVWYHIKGVSGDCMFYNHRLLFHWWRQGNERMRMRWQEKKKRKEMKTMSKKSVINKKNRRNSKQTMKKTRKCTAMSSLCCHCDVYSIQVVSTQQVYSLPKTAASLSCKHPQHLQPRFQYIDDYARRVLL